MADLLRHPVQPRKPPPQRHLRYPQGHQSRSCDQPRIADHIQLGNVTARRDWGFAGEYVRAMWLMFQQERSCDYVVATGVTHTVEDVCRLAFERVGLDYRDHVRVVEQPLRAPDALQLVSDPHKATHELSWSTTVTFEQLIARMVDADLAPLDAEEGSETE